MFAGTVLGIVDRRTEPPSAPAPPEVVALHLLYLAGLVEIALVVLALWGHMGRPTRALLALGVALPALTAAGFFYGLFLRRPRAPLWVLSHLEWLLAAQAGAAGVLGSALVLLVVGGLFALVLPPVAYLLYAPVVAVALLLPWLLFRLGFGWLALARRRPVGALRFAAELEAEAGPRVPA